jgi:hypothetical protein
VSAPLRPGADGSINGLKALAVILAVVLLGLALLAHGKNGTATAVKAAAATTTTTTTTVARSTTTTTTVPPASIKVSVLNGTNVSGLAGSWSTTLKAKGYNTLAPNNATSAVSASTIYVITPSDAGSADALAAAVGLTPASVVTTVPPNAPIPTVDLTAANLVLVVGPDLARSG